MYSILLISSMLVVLLMLLLIRNCVVCEYMLIVLEKFFLWFLMKVLILWCEVMFVCVLVSRVGLCVSSWVKVLLGRCMILDLIVVLIVVVCWLLLISVILFI